MTISRKAHPNLRDEHIPDLCLRLSTVGLGFILKVEHPFAQRNKVRDKVSQRRRMWLGKHWQQEGVGLTSCLTAKNFSQ